VALTTASKSAALLVAEACKRTSTTLPAHVLITVHDDGIGIPTDTQARIFEKLFRADNAIKTNTEGTGLGLYVAKMIMEASGGKIWFTSSEAKGTTFYVAIPENGMRAQTGEKKLT
jgi:two-component system sensor histidine kinase VicK